MAEDLLPLIGYNMDGDDNDSTDSGLKFELILKILSET